MNHSIKQLLLTAFCSLAITACGGGGGGGGGGAPSDTTVSTPQNSTASNTGNSEAAPASTSNEEASDNDELPTPDDNTITISWTAPSSRANSDPLNMSDIGGYQVYYYLQGTAEGSGTAVDIPNANTLSYTTPPLAAGTYFFSIATYDKNNVYGQMSSPVQATID